MYFNVCSLCSSLDIPSNINFLFNSLAGFAIFPATSVNFSKPPAAVPPNNAKSFELLANREFIFSISALVIPNFSIVVLTPLIPLAVVNPTSLNSLNDLYTLSLYSAPISTSLVEPSIARPNAATATPNTLATMPNPGKNINAAPIPYAALVTESFKSLTACAPTLAPRSPLYSASAIPSAALVTPATTDVAAISPAAKGTLLPVISNIFSCIWPITPSRLFTLEDMFLNDLTGSLITSASSRSLAMRLSSASNDSFCDALSEVVVLLKLPVLSNR